MSNYHFQVTKDNASYFIKLGSNTEMLVQQFLACLDSNDIEQLKTQITHHGKYIIGDQQEILENVYQLSLKIVNKMSIHIQSFYDDIPYKKEIYLLLSSRKQASGETLFNYRQKLFEMIEAMDLKIKDPKIKNEDTFDIEQSDAHRLLILDSKKTMEDEAKIYKDLLNQIEDNQKKIDAINDEIHLLNQKLNGADPKTKLKIYEEHKKLTQTLNRLYEENEVIEYKAQGETKITDAKSVKVIIDHYQDKIKKMDNQMGAIELHFSSKYLTDHPNFVIKPILKKPSLSKFASFYAVLFNILNRGSSIKPSTRLDVYSKADLSYIYKFQMLILSHIRYGYLDDIRWSYDILTEHQVLFKEAFLEITYWIEKLCYLANISYQVPELIMHALDGYKVRLEEDRDNKQTFVIINRPIDYIQSELWISDLVTYHILPYHQEHQKALYELLFWIFNFPNFRDGQIPIIANFLNGHNTLGILPTGAGKSLTYYFCVLMQPKISLVIAPINSLIIDQIEKLQEIHHINRFTNITSSNKNMNLDIQKLKTGESLFNFTSPERAQSQQFRDILITLNHTRTIGSIILDEVHCLSEWGHDFRVPYLMLAETLNTYAKGTRYLGLTATASVNVVRDLMIELSISDTDVITTEHMSRENLEFEIKSFDDVYDAQNDLISLIMSNFNRGTSLDFSNQHQEKNALLVFSQTKSSLESSVDVLYDRLLDQFRSIGFNHRDLVARYTGDYKNDQSDFMHDKKTIMIATKAFGMGIDKSNIRMTVHFGMPASREAFYQEAGRAGRDGNRSLCKLYAFRPSDEGISKLVREFLNPNTKPERMRQIMKYLSLLKVDIATTFYFFLGSYEEPLTESIRAMNTYEFIKEHQNYQVDLKNVKKNATEKYLYILFKLGIVKTWNIKYLFDKDEISSNANISVEINHRYEDIDYIKSNALKYINAYSIQDDLYIVEAEKKYINRIDDVKSIDELQTLILVMREWYHSLFITTRREQITNMYDMISDFANLGPTVEIQNVIDRFFNITEVISKTKEGYDLLTFDGVSLSDVIHYAFELNTLDLEDRKYEMQVVLQSNVNVKNSLYTSLIHLRLNDFEDSHNGNQRFEYALSQLNDHEKKEVVEACISHYQTLNEEQKFTLVKQLQIYDSHLIFKLYDHYQDDLLIEEFALHYIHSKFDESWE